QSLQPFGAYCLLFHIPDGLGGGRVTGVYEVAFRCFYSKQNMRIISLDN
ncbi:uncharacterized protein METZ01_LOCUS302983, partial [marine metagenome]